MAQLVATALLAVFFLIFSNAIAAYSTLVGGLVSVVSNSYFAVQAFRFRGARNAEKVVKSFMKGEMGKLAITLLAFVLIFTLITTINEVALITGFLATHIVGIVMSGMIDYSPSGNNG